MNEPGTHPEDITSDPAHSAEEGRDWSDEGGATETGPASHTTED